jgi:putative transposase
MSQSLAKNYIHIVFSTKHRQPLLMEPYCEELYTYMAGICNRMECYAVKIGGYRDHVHILCLLSKKIALMKLLEEVKSHSSKWMKGKDEALKKIYWQDGYGAFSVNPAQVETVAKYIERQKEHHVKQLFQDELRTFLHKYRVEYDERYVWD